MGRRVLRRELTVLLLAVAVMAQPWTVPGFKAVYNYDAKATGILSLRGKHIYGTVTYEFLNISDGKVYTKVILNVTVELPNGSKKKLEKESVVSSPVSDSLVFLTQESLKKLKQTTNVTCTNTTCTMNVVVNRVLNTGIKVKVVGHSVFDLKKMMLVKTESTMYVYASNNKLLGTLKTDMTLLKTYSPSKGSGQ